MTPVRDAPHNLDLARAMWSLIIRIRAVQILVWRYMESLAKVDSYSVETLPKRVACTKRVSGEAWRDRQTHCGARTCNGLVRSKDYILGEGEPVISAEALSILQSRNESSPYSMSRYYQCVLVSNGRTKGERRQTFLFLISFHRSTKCCTISNTAGPIIVV
jgi:hypothetical protein